jgi:signal transduction histidine kinase
LAESQRREGERAALVRQRIARDLHDSVSQLLFSTTLHVRTAQRALEVEQHDARVHGELVGLGQGVSASTVWPNTLPCGSSPI